MIIKLETYNKSENTYRDWNHRVTGIHMLSDVYWRESVTMVAVHMGVKEIGMQTGHKGAYNWSPSQESEQVHVQLLWSNQRSISMQ